ncbi:hypothetical protein BGZ83_006412 [Gryganskiella cystojenkinii]|nr:hypothetical protein BGZ83_006412 [Gryganskiella cystojenkinii]
MTTRKKRTAKKNVVLTPSQGSPRENENENSMPSKTIAKRNQIISDQRSPSEGIVALVQPSVSSSSPISPLLLSLSSINPLLYVMATKVKAGTVAPDQALPPLSNKGITVDRTMSGVAEVEIEKDIEALAERLAVTPTANTETATTATATGSSCRGGSWHGELRPLGARDGGSRTSNNSNSNSNSSLSIIRGDWFTHHSDKADLFENAIDGRSTLSNYEIRRGDVLYLTLNLRGS